MCVHARARGSVLTHVLLDQFNRTGLTLFTLLIQLFMVKISNMNCELLDCVYFRIYLKIDLNIGNHNEKFNYSYFEFLIVYCY